LQRGAAALAAGCDMVLLCNAPEAAPALLGGIAGALNQRRAGAMRGARLAQGLEAAAARCPFRVGQGRPGPLRRRLRLDGGRHPIAQGPICPTASASTAGDCPRLAGFLDQVRREHRGYHGRPVPQFGDAAAEFLIVALAPGMHGANRTGRPFTGDHAGIILYRTLHQFGFASLAVSEAADDPLLLKNCRISNAVKCLPPQNKPLPEEIRRCNRYLAAELRQRPPRVIWPWAASPTRRC